MEEVKEEDEDNEDFEDIFIDENEDIECHM